jgi:putative phosphoesterase
LSELEQPEFFETPITIAVIADTHFGARLRPLPDIVLETLRKSDLILHAGDFCSVEAYEMISDLGELRGVYGNNDALPLMRTLPARRDFRFGSFTAAMIHGHGYGRLTARQAAETVLQGTCDIAIFGHSHQAYREWQDGTLLFNPGSPTQRRWEPSYSYGIIRIDHVIDAKLHYFH